MFGKMRKVFGPAVVSVIVGAIALVFIFYGVFNPRGMSGLGSDRNLAEVNGTPITFESFQREYAQRMQFYQSMLKGKFDEKMFRQMGLKNQVLEDMIRQELILQEAKRTDIAVPDQEVRDQILKIAAFQKDGHFDRQLYESLLKANRFSAANFEERVREDLLRTKWIELVKMTGKLSDEEIREQYGLNKDYRQVSYVVFDKKELKDRAEQVIAQVKANPKDVERILKREGLKVQTTEKFNRSQNFISGIGAFEDLIQAAFQEPSPLQRGPQEYTFRGNTYLVFSLKEQPPNWNEFEKEKKALQQEALFQKEQRLFEASVAELKKRSKIKISSLFEKMEF